MTGNVGSFSFQIGIFAEVRIPIHHIILFLILLLPGFGPGGEFGIHDGGGSLSDQSYTRKFESAAPGSNRSRRFESEKNETDPAILSELPMLPSANYLVRNPILADAAGAEKKSGDNISVVSKLNADEFVYSLAEDHAAMFPDHHFW